MKHLFKQGDVKRYSKVVSIDELASFESGTVHEVYSTFALARDAEWSGRLFVLEMKDEDRRDRILSQRRARTWKAKAARTPQSWLSALGV